jgi:hypothetical protein
MPDFDLIKQEKQGMRDGAGGRLDNPASRPRGCRGHVKPGDTAAGRRGSTLDASVAPAGSRRAGYWPSRTTGLLRVPIPAISISIVSPCLTFSGAPSVPIQTTSPG